MAGRRDVVIDSIPMKVSYGDVRRLRITVRPPSGEVRVSAPHRTPEAQVLAFVRSRLPWLRATRAKLMQPQEDGVRVWGRLVRLDVTTRPGRRRAQLGYDALAVSVPAPGQADAAIDAWRADELAAALPPLIARWEPRLGVAHKALTLRKMTSRWGSCNRATGRLTFNTELTRHDPALLEYVVVHELAHLLVANHGPDFQALMTAHLPDWRHRRRVLNGRT